jgi:predicted kinase
MPQAILTVGIPASGKSTWAREYSTLYGIPIVCRDDIRAMQGLKHGQNEEMVTAVAHALIEGLIAEGKDFIVADTNINKKFRNKLVKFCHQRGCDVNLIVFDISLDEAILRDANREASVGPDVIQRMYADFKGQNIQPGLLPYPRYNNYKGERGEKDYRYDAVVADIDGTVARHVGRSPYDYTRVSEDEPIQDVIDILNIIGRTHPIIFVSGRDDSCREDTLEWIEKYTTLERGINFKLLMRKTGDQRPDYVIKNEIYDKEIIPYTRILMVFDDRDQVVTHLRLRGITVAQVAPGRF